MIKITRAKKPVQLTRKLVISLTQKFKQNKSNVWAVPYIKSRLFKMSHGKCCFCETELGKQGKYMHVEHFHHKDDYPDEVVLWDNLLPACAHCNSNKGTHDTVKVPIIDPTKDDPRVHLTFDKYRFKCRNNSQLGKRTIEVVYLNDSDMLVTPRFEIGNAALDTLNELLDKAIKYRDGIDKTTRRKNIIVNGTKSLLREAHPTAQYSATVASTIFREHEYTDLKTILISQNLWDQELTNLENDIITTSLYQ